MTAETCLRLIRAIRQRRVYFAAGGVRANEDVLHHARLALVEIRAERLAIPPA